MAFEPQHLNQAVADVLHGARSTARLTQKQFADAAKMSPVTVQKLLSGKQSIKVPQFVTLANAAQADPSQLLGSAIAKAEQLSAAGATKDELDAKRKQKRPAPTTADEADDYKGDRAATEYEPEADAPDSE